jgi:hypothetical protein
MEIHMASSRITLSVDPKHYQAARKAARRMDTTVSRLTDLFFQTLSTPGSPDASSKLAGLRGAFRSPELDERKTIAARLRSKHLK